MSSICLGYWIIWTSIESYVAMALASETSALNVLEPLVVMMFDLKACGRTGVVSAI